MEPTLAVVITTMVITALKAFNIRRFRAQEAIR
jgi:hypothetical protein